MSLLQWQEKYQTISSSNGKGSESKKNSSSGQQSFCPAVFTHKHLNITSREKAKKDHKNYGLLQI